MPIDPLEALTKLERFGVRPGLGPIRLLTAALGAPQTAYRSIIVAGTNGKGSVVAMTDRALRAAGHRVGRYTSPHLITLTERFVVDGTEIPEHELRYEATQLHTQVDRLLTAGRLTQPPTFFEATTAMALSWFRRTGVELALLEVGLGGRLDATNVVTPVAGVITPIALDHQQYLGDTVEAIAVEKAGVIKPGMVVVTTETAPALVALFEETCRRRGARLVRAEQGTAIRVAPTGHRSKIGVTTPGHAYPGFRPGLAGAHQRSNAVGAIRLLEELAGIGIPVGVDAIVTGLSTVVWPGRLDLAEVAGRGTILLDAAHNPAAAAALAAYLRGAFPGGLPIVLSVMDDKDVSGIVERLAPCATRIVCTAPKTSRAVPARVLAQRVRHLAGSTPVTADHDSWGALEAAWCGSQTVCATGSIFLVGEVLAKLRAESSLPRPAANARSPA